MTTEIPLKKQQEVLEVLANTCLCNMTPQDWTANDLSNTLIILASIAYSLAWENPEYRKLPSNLQAILVDEFGENLHQSVQLFTGINPTKDATTNDPLDADHIEETAEAK